MLPSLTESFGLVYAEALTQGLPVIYSAGQGFDQQFPEGFVGYHVNPLSPEDIVCQIQQVIKEYDSLQPHCGEAAAQFSQDAVCACSEAYYREAVNTGNC